MLKHQNSPFYYLKRDLPSKTEQIQLRPKNKLLHTQSMCIIVSLLQDCDFKLLFFLIILGLKPQVQCVSLDNTGIKCCPIWRNYTHKSKHQIPALAWGYWNQVTMISAHQPKLSRAAFELSVFNAPIALVLFTEGSSFMEKSRRDWFRLMWLQASTKQYSELRLTENTNFHKVLWR